ncbi:MAG: hypothetical protein FWC55_08785 [Firmicutes bacterium]|nr:hypothetical protein [Bacillota bacterium]
MADKTGAGLVEYAKSKLGTAYVYGCKMEVLTRAKYDWLKKTYGSLVWDSDAAKIGKVCCDCSGLISAYTGVMRSSAQYRQAAAAVYPISAAADAPAGALVWKSGHIGVYAGLENGVPMYIAEDGSAYGCRKAKLPSSFTDWFLCADIGYPAEKAAAGEPERGAVLEAIAELARRGVIGSPEYWEANYGKTQYLDRLIVNMAEYGKKVV